MVFNQKETEPYRKAYYDLLSKLSKNPNDVELKNRALDAGNEYYRRIKTYKLGYNGGNPSENSIMRIIGPLNEKSLYEDMSRIVNKNK